MRGIDASHRRRCRASQHGFTLLELLVVLVIVAAMAAMLVFYYRSTPQQQMQREASELVAVLNAAADEAVMRGIEIGVVIDGDGYRFVAFDPKTKQWQEAAASGLALHRFPQHYAIDFALDGSDVDERTMERIKLLAQRADDERLHPSILILSSGETTPFKLVFRIDKDAASTDQKNSDITLLSDGLNPVRIDNADSEQKLSNADKSNAERK